MLKEIKLLLSNPFFSGSLIMIIGSNATNFLNYLYHLFMGRMLGPAHYGELAALLSFITLLGILPLSLSLVVIRFISSAKNNNYVANFLYHTSKKVLVGSIALILAILLFSGYISDFLAINNNLLIILATISFVFSLNSLLYRSVLQGLLRFDLVVLNTLVENISKLFFGVILVFLGLVVFGAALGLVIATFIGYVFSLFLIRKYRKRKEETSLNLKPILLYSLPVLIQSIAATALLSVDLLLVKHFFSQYQVGIYAATGALGKIIFFGTGPISAVMFSLISKNHAQGKKITKELYFSLLLTTLFCGFILVIYYLFPDISINMLYGKSYLLVRNYLIEYSIFITIFSFCVLLINFFLSIGKTKVVFLSLLAAIAQIIGIWFIHDDLSSVIRVSLIVEAVLLICLLGYLVPVIIKNETKD